jgi:hypothetical protein
VYPGRPPILGFLPLFGKQVQVTTWLKWSLSNFLPGLVLKYDPSNLSLPNSSDFRHEPWVPHWKKKNFLQISIKPHYLGWECSAVVEFLGSMLIFITHRWGNWTSEKWNDWCQVSHSKCRPYVNKWGPCVAGHITSYFQMRCLWCWCVTRTLAGLVLYYSFPDFIVSSGVRLPGLRVLGPSCTD